MNKKNIIIAGIIACFGILLCTISLISIFKKDNIEEKLDRKELTGTVMQYQDGVMTIQDDTHAIYTCSVEDSNFNIGDSISMEYTGILNKNYSIEDCQVISYEVVKKGTDDNGIPANWQDNGIFGAFYKQAYNKLKTMTLGEKIGQILLARYPDANQVEEMKKYHLGGFVFFERDFASKSATQTKSMLDTLQNNSKIPLLTAVDEEGGKVVRISSNSALASEKFKSPSELYKAGAFPKIKEDTIQKSALLRSLGLNVNLAPVVDVSTNPSDYMYDRALQENTSLTSTYASTVIKASKGTGVSYTLKHFPGYGNNADTHVGGVTDNRSYDDILKNDIPPFKEGINAGAEAVLVSHNVISNIDANNPASLSASVHNILRKDLGFTGIIITDDIAMGALKDIGDVTVKAITAGNDIIITTDYEESFNSIKDAISRGSLSEEQIDKLAFRVISWKYYKMLMAENEK